MEDSELYFKNILLPLIKKYTKLNNKMKKIRFYKINRKRIYKKLIIKYRRKYKKFFKPYFNYLKEVNS